MHWPIWVHMNFQWQTYQRLGEEPKKQHIGHMFCDLFSELHLGTGSPVNLSPVLMKALNMRILSVAAMC